MTFRLFDVAHGLDRTKLTEHLPLDKKARRRLLRVHLRQVLGIGDPKAKAARGKKTGELAISAPVYHVEILINGQPRGTAPIHLRELPVGTYDILARRGGYVDWKGTVQVKAGETTWVAVKLEQAPYLPEPPGVLESIRWPTLLTAGVGLVAIGVGVGFAIDLNAQQSKFDRSPGETPEEIVRMQQHKDAGDTDALIANIMFGIGGAALVGSVVMAYLDYRSTRPIAPSEESPKAALPVSIGPGSVLATFQF